MKLSILIPTLIERVDSFKTLYDELKRQADGKGVEILHNIDNREKKIGTKRNELIAKAKGDYIVFIDDDDRVPEYYVSEILKAIKTNPDCVGITGYLIWDYNREKMEVFEHQLGNQYTTISNGKSNVYYRYPNHLNPMKRELVKDIKFKEINFQEDYEWATEINNRKILKTTVNIKDVMYYYLYDSKKKRA